MGRWRGFVWVRGWREVTTASARNKPSAEWRLISRRRPKKIVLAVPVAPQEALDKLRREADLVVCLENFADFDRSVGACYAEFLPTSDAEVIAALAKFAPSAET